METEPGEQIIFRGHPSWRAVLDFYLKGILAAVIIGAIGYVIGQGAGAAVSAFVVVVVVVVVGAVKRIGTLYVVSDERLHIRRGIIARRVQETRLERVQNVNTDQSALERLLRVGTVDFDTAGSDDSDFSFVGVADPEGVARAVDRAQRAASHRDAPDRPEAEGS